MEALNDELILASVKDALGITEDYEVFDSQIIMHLNTVFAILTQLGVGPETGFYIVTGEEKWSDLIGTSNTLTLVKTWVYMKTKLMFDPPTSSYTQSAIENNLKELEYRIEAEIEYEK